MPGKIKFHLDEHVASAIAEGLRRRGFEVTTTAESRLLAASDEDHMAFATTEGQVLVTHDPDFVAMHRQGRHHTGIAYCRSASRSIGEMLRGLVLIGEVLSPEEMRDHVEFL